MLSWKLHIHLLSEIIKLKFDIKAIMSKSYIEVTDNSKIQTSFCYAQYKEDCC